MSKYITHECKNCEGTWTDQPYDHCPYCNSIHMKTELEYIDITNATDKELENIFEDMKNEEL